MHPSLLLPQNQMIELKQAVEAEQREREVMHERVIAPVWEEVRKLQVCALCPVPFVTLRRRVQNAVPMTIPIPFRVPLPFTFPFITCTCMM